MTSGVRSRLAVVVLLLLLQTVIVGLELLIFMLSVSTRKWYALLRQWLGPIGIALLGVILVAFGIARTAQ